MKKLLTKKRRRQQLPHPDNCDYREADSSPQDPRLWFQSIKQHRVHEVQQLINLVDVDVTYYDKDLSLIVSGLHLAALNANIAILKLLLQAPCNVNVQAQQPSETAKAGRLSRVTPLHLAVHAKNFWAVHHLIRAGCNIKAPFEIDWEIEGKVHRVEMDAVFLAAEKGCTDVMDELLQHGANANSEAKFCATGTVDTSALHIAVKGGHKEIVRLLLKYGADVNIHDSVQCCPLLWAVFINNADIVHTLLKHKATQDARIYQPYMDGLCLTALQLAAVKGFEHIMLLLCQRGVNLDDICPLTGKTALHLAAFADYPSIVKMLIERGASTNLLDFDGKSPLMYARERNNYEVIPILEKAEQDGLRRYGWFFWRGRKTTAGVCLIINNKDFYGNGEASRTNSVHDVEIMKKAFAHLGYKVIVRENLKGSEHVQVIRDVQQNNVRASHESFVCCLMSHGNYGIIVGVDGETVKIADLTAVLSARACPQLSGKTKIFIVEACQGTDEDKAVCVGSTSLPLLTTQALPSHVPTAKMITERDFLIWMATLPGNVAYLETAGSPFLQILGKRLLRITEMPERMDDVVMDVNKEVAEYQMTETFGDVVLKLKQTPYYVGCATAPTLLRHRKRLSS